MGCEDAACTLRSSSRCPPAAQSARPRQAARAAPGLHQGASLGVLRVVSRVTALALWSSGGLGSAPQGSLCSASLCPRFWLQFLSTCPTKAWDPSHLQGFSSPGFLLAPLSLHALQDHTVTLITRKDGSPFGILLGLLASCPGGPRRQQGGLPAHSPNNTLTESLLCPLGIGSQKSLMSELCI